MAILRLKPTSYTISKNPSGSVIQNPETLTSGNEPESSSSGLYMALRAKYSGSYSSDDCPVIKLQFTLPSGLDEIPIESVTAKFKFCCYNRSDRGSGAVSFLRNGSNTDDYVHPVVKNNSSEAQSYMNSAGELLYSSLELPSEYLSTFASNTWEIKVSSGYYSEVDYFSNCVLDIEYYPNAIKIGTSELDGAFLGRSWIEKIYKGAALLFDKSAPSYTYTTLKYIQGTGTQYIDTGIKMNSSVNIEADAEIRQFAWNRENAPTDLAGIFGNISCGDPGGNRAGLRFYTQRNFYWYYSNTGWPAVWPSDDTFYSRNIYKNVGNVFYINGTSTITGTTGSWSDATNNALLFSMGENPKAGMKLYGAKLYDNGTLVRDFVPSKRSDGVIGLYDNVSNTFFMNAGTGVFYEPIPNEYQEVEYIQSSGNGHNTGQHIDTGYFPTDGDVFRVNMTVMPLSVPKTEREYLAKYGNGGTNIQIGYASINSWNMSNADSLFRYTQERPYKAVNKKTYIDGEITISGTSSVSLYLFAQNESPGNTNSAWDSSIRLYACTISVNAEVIRNYVPCYRKSDGVIGLYDTINREFKTNEGTGSFTKGSDIN